MLQRALAVLGFAAWFAGWGWAIDALWRRAAVPDHATWGGFFAVWLPLAWFCFTVASILLPADARPLSLRIGRQVRASLGLLLFLLMETSWRGLGTWPVWFGLFFVGSIVVRGALFLWPLWREPPAASAPKAVAIRIFVGSLLVYGLLAPWVLRTLPVAGDEPHYLLISHSLLVDRDLYLQNNYEQGDYRPFHPGRLSPQGQGTEPVSAHGVGFPLLLLPGYAAGGRLGATWLVVLLTALLSLNVYWLCLELSGSPRASLQAWSLTAFTVPIATYAHQLFPEVAAALGTLYAYRQFRADPVPPARTLLGGALAAFAVVFLKVRYAPVALALWAQLLFRRVRDRRWLWRWVPVFLVLLVALPVLDWLVFDGVMMLRRFGAPAQWLSLLGPNRYHAIGVLGLLVDQKGGLLMLSPVYLFGFLGLAILMRERRPDGFVIPLTGLVYLYLLIAHTQERWHGEFSPSPRYLVVVLPLLSGPLAVALHRCRGRLFAVTRTTLAVYSLAMAAVLIVMPRWRFRTGGGQNTVLAVVGQGLSVNLIDWFPSLIAPTPYGVIVAGAGLALTGGLLRYFYSHAVAE